MRTLTLTLLLSATVASPVLAQQQPAARQVAPLATLAAPPAPSLGTRPSRSTFGDAIGELTRSMKTRPAAAAPEPASAEDRVALDASPPHPAPGRETSQLQAVASGGQ